MAEKAVPEIPILPASGMASTGRAPWLVCRAGIHRCALPLAHVIEIMRALPIESVAGAPACVRGLCVIRGAAVPVVDTGLLIGRRPTECHRLIAVRAGARTVALTAEAVLGIWAIDRDIIRALPPLLSEAAGDTIAGIGTADAELMYFLRTALIIPEDVLDRLTTEGAAA